MTNGRLDCTFVSDLIVIHVVHVFVVCIVFFFHFLFCRNHQRHGKSSGEICGCVQLLGSDGLQRTGANFQRLPYSTVAAFHRNILSRV